MSRDTTSMHVSGLRVNDVMHMSPSRLLNRNVRQIKLADDHWRVSFVTVSRRNAVDIRLMDSSHTLWGSMKVSVTVYDSDMSISRAEISIASRR